MLEGAFETLAYMRFFGEMPSKVDLLPEGSWITPMPECLCRHLLGTSTAFPVGSEKWHLVSGSTRLQLPTPSQRDPSNGKWPELPTSTVASSLQGISIRFQRCRKTRCFTAPCGKCWEEACCLHHAGQHLLQHGLGLLRSLVMQRIALAAGKLLQD